MTCLMMLPNITVLNLEGRNVTVGYNGRNIVVNDKKLLKADIIATNGVIHVIDNFLLDNRGKIK